MLDATLRQMRNFAGVGVLAALAHYGALIALVELARWGAVPATLIGYIAGGVVSYALNRRHTFISDRPHQEAGWRFALVAGVGFGLTFALMSLWVGAMGVAYLPAQIVTTLIVLAWSFTANRWWTFRPR